MLINIRANWKNAKNGMNSVLGHAKGIGSRISGAFAAAKNALGSVAGMMGIGLGTAAAIRGINTMINKMDTIGKQAANLGVSVEYFQKMQFAADRTGTSFDAVQTGLARMAKLSAQAVAGDKTGMDAFAQIGIGVEKLRRMKPEELFDEVTMRLQAMEDPQLKNAAAADLLGKNFVKLNNFMKDHIALGQELEGRGGIVNAEQIKAAEQYKDIVSNITTSLQAWTINSGFMGQLAKMAEGLEALVSVNDRLKKQGISTGTEEYDANEGWLKRTVRKSWNAFSFGLNLGDKAFGRPEERMSTAAIDRNSPEYQAKNAAYEAGKVRAAETNKAAKAEAELRAAVTARSRASEMKALEDAQAKATPKTELEEAQAAIAGSATKAKAAKITTDSLQRIGGYSGGMKANQALDVAKKQVDILGQLDKKLAVLETAARDGGLLFP